jgi:hypothetical protein
MDRGTLFMSIEHSPGKLAYGINDAVQATGLGRSFLYEAIKAGDLKTFKAGTRTLITIENLRGWLSSFQEDAA